MIALFVYGVAATTEYHRMLYREYYFVTDCEIPHIVI